MAGSILTGGHHDRCGGMLRYTWDVAEATKEQCERLLSYAELTDLLDVRDVRPLRGS